MVERALSIKKYLLRYFSTIIYEAKIKKYLYLKCLISQMFTHAYEQAFRWNLFCIAL